MPVNEQHEEIRAYATNGIRSSLTLPDVKSKGSAAAVDEIKAWSTFDNLGKSARNLNLNRRSRASITTNSASYVPVGFTTHIQGQAYDEVESPAVNNRSSSVHDRWERVSGLVFASDLKLGEVLEEDEESAQEKVTLNPSLLSKELGLFSVYFDSSDLWNDSTIVGKTSSFYNKSTTKSIINCISRFLPSFIVALNGTMPWLPSYINNFDPTLSSLFQFIEWNLRSLGQVFFCNNPISGLFFVIALAIQSIYTLVYGIIAILVGNSFSLLLRFDRGLIGSGLFGYNSILCGLAIATFHTGEEKYDLSLMISTIVVSVFSVIIFVTLGKALAPYKCPPFTVPFVLATLSFLIATSTMANVSNIMVVSPSIPSYNNELEEQQSIIIPSAFGYAILRGIGQVFFADNIISAVLILLGIAICSRYLAMAAFLGSLIGNGISVLCGSDNSMIESGLFGFNGCLVFTAMALFYVPSVSTFLLSIVAVVLTVLLQHTLNGFLSAFGLPGMTLPFCVISIALIFLQGTTDVMISVPLSSITIPEDHLKRVLILKEGFHYLQNATSNKVLFGTRHSSKLSSSQMRSSRKMEKIHSREGSVEDIVEKGDEVDKLSYSVFQKISSVSKNINDDSSSSSSSLLFVSKYEFLAYLQENGLKDQIGLSFAEKAFSMMDFNRDDTLKAKEFLSFCRISLLLFSIRDRIKTFFDFVDADGNDDIHVDEINSALAYLEEPELTEEEVQVLFEVSGGSGRSNNYGESIYALDIINFVTIAALKEMISSIE